MASDKFICAEHLSTGFPGFGNPHSSAPVFAKLFALQTRALRNGFAAPTIPRGQLTAKRLLIFSCNSHSLQNSL